VNAILGLGPAVFLIAGALAVGPAGRISDRVGRMPVIRFGFVLGIAGPAVTALGCWTVSGPLVFLGLGLCGASQAIVILSRAAAAEMFPPDFRARGMSFVLFGAVSGAIWGPLVFGPIFADRALTPHELAGPWLGTSLFAVAGLVVAMLVRPDPKELSKRYPTEAGDDGPAAPLAEILRRPGVAVAMVAAVASFAVMVGVMNLAGAVIVGHGHGHGDVFTVISAHIVGMYGLVLVVGDLIDRFGRRRALAGGLVTMGVSTLSLAWVDSIGAMSLSLFGLGLGWVFAYVGATSELVDRAALSERGRLVGFSDLLSGLTGATLAVVFGAVYTELGMTEAAVASTVAVALPALVISLGTRRPRRPEALEPAG